ncbi:major facilitator superfamily MFS-1 [Xylariaceae sp. AK1471]|nr:major facilitator superfamily MFS-1 [Xylariaceae sp. AK1471]
MGDLGTSVTQACVIVLPTIGRDFNIPPGRLQWVLSAPTAAYAGTLLFWGRAADICSRRIIFQLGLACICLSCLVAPFAPEEISFYLFRAFQGLGAAAATPTAVGLIFTMLSPGKQQIYAMSTFAAGFPLGNVVGNVLGGIITRFLSWKWIFWILSIVAATSCGVSLIVIPHSTKEAELQSLTLRQRLRKLAAEMEGLGLLALTGFLILLFVSLTEGNVVGWTSAWVLTLLVVAITLLPIFILWEIHLEKKGGSIQPLMKLSVFNSRVYCATQAIVFIFWGSFDIFLVFATYFYQDYQGLDVLQTTLRFLPTGITGLVAVFVSSQILSRVDGSTVVLWGTACVSIPCLLFAVPIPPETIYWAYGFPAMVLLTLGGDTLYPCLSLFAMKSVLPENQAMGAAVFQNIGQVGSSTDLAIATAIQISFTKARQGSCGEKEALLVGYKAADWFGFAIGVIAFVLAIYGFRGAGTVWNRQLREQAEPLSE